MGLLDLPSELIAQIFVHLEDEDVFKARLSNKSVEKASFAHFGKRFFRKKGFMITSFSIGTLERISEHDGLRKYMQHVWFNPDCYTFAKPQCAPDDEDSDMDEADELITPLEKKYSETTATVNSLLAKQYDAYRTCMLDHGELMYTDLLERKLTHAMRLLPNLETVGMRRSEDYGPYGWKLLSDAIGEDPRVLGPIPTGPSLTLSGPTQLFIAIIGAVATVGAQLRRLYTDAVEIDNIRADILPQSRLNAACSSLWYVELNAVKGWLVHRDPSDRTYNILKDAAEYGSGLARLFKAMPNLREIGLQVFPDRKQSHLVAPSARNPESWRQSYPYLTLSRLTNEVTFQNLTRIKLEKLTTTSSILQNFLEPSASHLTSLKIRDIRLLSSEEEPRPWQTLFSFLCTQCPELDYILCYHLMYDRGGVSFVEDPPSAIPTGQQDYLVDHVPPSHGGQALFTGYDHITLEVSGREDVKRRLDEVRERHWYHKPLFSYAMDEELWHTDTSDEE